MSVLRVPDPSLVLLVGLPGHGQEEFARRWFRPEEIFEAPDPEVSFDLVHSLLAARMSCCVIPADPASSDARQPWRTAARRAHLQTVAVSFAPPVPGSAPHGWRHLSKEGHAVLFDAGVDWRGVEVRREPLDCDLTHVEGPFDVIGDVHGCTDELEELLGRLGWRLEWQGEGVDRKALLSHPEGRTLVFVGDACDRGPRPVDAVLIMQGAVESGVGHAVASNHDDRFRRWMEGNAVKVAHGLDVTIADLESRPEGMRERLHAFLSSLPGHAVFEGGRLAVAHAGLKEGMILGAGKACREFAMNGPSLQLDDGTNERQDWASDYAGETEIIYGHVAGFGEPEWVNGTACIDTACVFGGSLTAMRWPERETVSVPARRRYAEPGRALLERPGPPRRLGP